MDHRASICEEWCVRIWSCIARDALWAEDTGHQPSEWAAQFSRVGSTNVGWPEKVSTAHGPTPGGAILLQGVSPSSATHPELPLQWPKEPAINERSRGRARAHWSNPKKVKRAKKCALAATATATAITQCLAGCRHTHSMKIVWCRPMEQDGENFLSWACACKE